MKILETGLKALKCQATPDQMNLWVQYVELLAKWNKVYNLSGITDVKAMMIRHVLDSLCVGDSLDKDNIKVIADIGTGAGVPGIPLAILFPQKKFILVEPRQKKVIFLKQALTTLGLKNIEIGHGKVEALPIPDVRPDVIISRAFAKLADMLNLTQSWAKNETAWFAMKAEVQPDELKNIPDGYRVAGLIRLNPPFEKAVRSLVVVTK